MLPCKRWILGRRRRWRVMLLGVMSKWPGMLSKESSPIAVSGASATTTELPNAGIQSVASSAGGPATSLAHAQLDAGNPSRPPSAPD